MTHENFIEEITRKQKLLNGGTITKEQKEMINELALEDSIKAMDNAFQGVEYRDNSVGGARGDYPFLTFTFGECTDPYAILVSESILRVRKNGQGKKGKKHCVVFPKLVFLYVEELHGEGKPFEYLYDEAIDCRSKAMYPDYLSLSGDSIVAEIYKKYKKIISPMGCRAYLSAWYKRGGMYPADENDEPVFIGRANIGRKCAA